MAITMQRTWECDNCHYVEIHKTSNSKPLGWVAFKWNDATPMGSMDADGWNHDLLCHSCWDAVGQTLDDEAQDDWVRAKPQAAASEVDQ